MDERKWGTGLALAFIAGIVTAGCGNSPVLPPPVGEACKGILISGTMLDSLTSQPVSTGRAALESGTQLAPAAVYAFSETAAGNSGTDGSFNICAETVVEPSAIVLVALDSSGAEYPPFVVPITGATNLGKVLMGGCSLTCGLEGQQQTSAPATIGGLITTAPGALSGSVMAEYALEGLDASGNIWDIFVPSADSAQGSPFTTVQGSCQQNSSPCDTYSFTLPSQKPTRLVHGTYTQSVGPPSYVIYAVPDSPVSCMPPFGLSAVQHGGTLPLVGLPGKRLTAADIVFSDCH